MAAPARPGSTSEAEVRRLKALYQLLSALHRANGLQDVYDAALTSLLASTFATRAAILLFDSDGVIRFKASRGLSDTYQVAVTGHSPWRQGARDASAIVVPDVQEDEQLRPYAKLMQEEGIRALAFVPLLLDSGVIGKFMLYYPEPHSCGNDELEMAQAIAAHVALATGHKRAELARAQTEQQFQAILDNSASVIYLKDLQGRFTLVNRRFEQLFHVPRTSMVGRTDYDAFPPETAERFQANDRSVIEAGRAMALEEYAPHDDGLHSYISMKFPIDGPDGTVAGVCGISTDITEQKRLEAASRHLAAIVENSNDAIISKDLDGIITSWNKGAERVLGYSAEEAIGRPVSMLAEPGRPSEMPAILARIRNGERVEHYETRRRRKDGTIIDVALTVSPIRDRTGRIVGASKIARDITEQKRAEEERGQLLAREQEARRTAELLNRVGPRLVEQLDLEKLVEEVTDIATALVGAEFGSLFHNVVDANGESYMLYTLSGVPREAFAGFPMPRNTDLFAATFRGESVVRCDDVTQDPRYGKNPPYNGMPQGHLPVCSYLAAPVVARSGEVLGGLFFGHSQPGKFSETHEAIVAGIAAQAAIAIDNARLFEQAQRIQSELRRSNEDLQRANRDLEAFAYSASHDLQEPLRTIAISAELIERNCGTTLQGDDAIFLENIRHASRRMNALIEDLLAYSRAARQEESPTPTVNSGRVLTAVLENLRGAIDEAKAHIETGELPPVPIHEGRLAQLFQNLVGNALKYRAKDETPRVSVTADREDGFYVFSVSDNGIGIEPQFADQVFGLFKRLHAQNEYPGTGVGLAICQRIAEQYGGRMWLERSAPGQGSTFCFSVPVGHETGRSAS